MKYKISTLLFGSLLLVFLQVKAQLTPQDAIKQMKRGINIGNTMEPTPGGEGTWGNPVVQEYAFDDYTTAGFNAVRIPVTWDNHTSTTFPYSVAGSWMDRVEQVVDWGLSRGLMITLDAHHEGFIKNSYTTANKARFDSIWSQISIRFKDKSEKLLFEMINEPNGLQASQVNQLNARVLKIIRKTNPTRIVIFSGNNYSGAAELIAAAVPNTTDPHLIGYYHSYDPYPFGLVGTGTYGTDADIATTTAQFDQVTTWATQKGIPVVLDEFGSMKKCDYNSRMTCYATVVDQALRHNIPFFAWDDGGDFPIYQRKPGVWNEIKDILIYTYPHSPNKFKFGFMKNSHVILSWQNRTSANSNVIVQRSLSTITGVKDPEKPEFPVFEDFAQLPAGASQFEDSSVTGGKSYYYRLKITVGDTLMQSYPIFTGPVKPGTATDVADAIEKSAFNIYPNPASGQVTVQTKVAGDKVTVQIYDAFGKLFKTQIIKGGTSVVNIEGLASGIYSFVLSTGITVETKKVVVN